MNNATKTISEKVKASTVKATAGAKEAVNTVKEGASNHRGVLGLVAGIFLTLVVVAAKGYRDASIDSGQ